MFPRHSDNLVEDLIFVLTYVQHGGSGLMWSRQDVLEMDFQAAMAATQKLEEARKRDADAIKKASRRKR